MSYAATVAKAQAQHTSGSGRGGNKLFLITGGKDEKGLDVWHYVRVSSLRQVGFNRAVMSGKVTFTDFGEVVCSGYGDAPPEDVRTRMEAEENA